MHDRQCGAMKIHDSLENFGKITNPVVTTGSFDGVHIGHKAIICKIKNLASQHGGESVIISFTPHPRSVIQPQTSRKLKLINTQKEKIMLLNKTGIDHLFHIHFTREFSHMSSHEFAHNFLIKKLGAKCIVVGYNHHFGHDRQGNFNYLKTLSKTHHFELVEIPQQDIETEAVSSTKIREALLRGDIQKANAYLDHSFIMSGVLGPGEPLDQNTAYTTSKLQIEEKSKIIPPDGIYAATINLEHSTRGCLMLIKRIRGMFPRVDICFLDGYRPSSAAQAVVHLHKRIGERMDALSSAPVIQDFENDINKISELIINRTERL